jgi:hypothetical protein
MNNYHFMHQMKNMDKDQEKVCALPTKQYTTVKEKAHVCYIK